MDIVIQGAIYPHTVEAAINYLQLDFVDNVIISTWKSEDIADDIGHRIIVVKSDKPVIWNNITMNYQIVSSFEGIKKSTNSIIAKTRSDQMFSLTSMIRINEYWNKHKNELTRKFIDGSGPRACVCVLGINRMYAFHPQDHMFWGYTEDVKKIFDIPLMPEELHTYKFNVQYRFPIYLGANYAARFDARIYDYMKEYTKYLATDQIHTVKNFNDIYNSMDQHKREALQLSWSIMDDIFKPVPKIDMIWEKYRSGYWYKQYSHFGEYYGESW